MHKVLGLGLLIGALAGPAFAQTSTPSADPAPREDMRELVEAAKATAKATRETVDYVRVQPDLLYQILAKLDKVEDKLDKIEEALKRDTARARR